MVQPLIHMQIRAGAEAVQCALNVRCHKNELVLSTYSSGLACLQCPAVLHFHTVSADPGCTWHIPQQKVVLGVKREGSLGGLSTKGGFFVHKGAVHGLEGVVSPQNGAFINIRTGRRLCTKQVFSSPPPPFLYGSWLRGGVQGGSKL